MVKILARADITEQTSSQESCAFVDKVEELDGAYISIYSQLERV